MVDEENSERHFVQKEEKVLLSIIEARNSTHSHCPHLRRSGDDFRYCHIISQQFPPEEGPYQGKIDPFYLQLSCLRSPKTHRKCFYFPKKT